MHDVLIIGAGPAGLSSALWCDELGLDTLVLEQGSEIGGQLLSVYNRVENYPGVRAANGRELRDLFAAQLAEKDFDLWTEVEIESVDLRAKRIALRSGEQQETSLGNVFAIGDVSNPRAPTISGATGAGATAAKMIASRLAQGN
jgi:thioredoxin reductase (NADPH)